MPNKRDSHGNLVDHSLSSTYPASHTNQTTTNKTTRNHICNFEGCGRAYTRAEHLSRHQLNHNPKDIYRCDFPGCPRTFVRQDLCIRHRDRHDAPSSKNGDAATSDEDDSSENVTRRVGRPRLSSLSKSGTIKPLDRNIYNPSIAIPADTIQYNPSDGHLQHQHSTQSNTPSIQPHAQHTGNLPSNMLAQTPSHAMDFSVTGSSTGHKPDYSLSTLPESFTKSPTSVRDELTSWLFDEQFANANGFFFPTSMNALGSINDYMPIGTNPMFSDLSNDNFLSDFAFDPQSSISDSDVASTDDIAWISTWRRSKLIELMQVRFVNTENQDVTSWRDRVFAGDIDAEDHVLSHRSMQLYLGSYWKHFHRQMPILHQATFLADTANELLVLAVMIIGASLLGSHHGQTKTDACSEFATFVAWHLRWQIFMHPDFRPPAKLWGFQSLLLLEIFEKMGTTRQMHERAHVHSATMINLMRRGTTLVGDDETARRTPGPSTPDEAWHRWIKTESKRRAAFAAFVINTNHAVMFGHAAMMVVRELRLLLPCDDALWSATSAAEVGRVHASLHTHGIKPTTFLEGLRETLTGRKVRTNDFGRTILMAGLMSIKWHLAHRDLQVSNLGASVSLGGTPGIWREALSKSFDFWKCDFDDSMSHMKTTSLAWHQVPSSEDRDASATAHVLHHLSHITLHAEVLDCQIYIGATKLFGRAVSEADYERTKHKMLEWVKTSAARSAAFHAIQLIKPVVLSSFPSTQDFFNCRDDHLLNRGWAIYYSLLVLFTYGFALDGTLRPFPSHLQEHISTHLPSPQLLWSHVQSPTETLTQARLDDARLYLTTIGNVKSPDDLHMMQSGRNRLVGLFGLFANSFRHSRWELLQEGAKRLEKAIDILKDGAGI